MPNKDGNVDTHREQDGTSSTQLSKNTSSELSERIISLKRRLNAAGKEVQQINDQGRLALTDRNEIVTFKGMFRALEKYYLKYETIWEELVDLHISANKADFPSDKDNLVKQSIRKYYYEANVNIEKLTESNVNSSTFGSNISMANDTKSVQSLPRMNLIKFDGQIRDWPKFRDTFLSLVHNDNNIPCMQKFHYLCTSLTGHAASVINHLPLQEGNYILAWEALNNTYNNKRILAAAYLNNILSFKPQVGAKPSINSLQTFLTEICDSVSAFKLLKIENESEFILFHLAVKCLDAVTREQFEVAHKSISFPSFTNLSTYVRERSLALQLAEGNDTTSSHKSSFQSKDSIYKPSNRTKMSLMTSSPTTSSKTFNGKASSCIVCSNGLHNILSCKNFLAASVPQRLQMLKYFNGCRACLSYNHKTGDCYSKWACKLCGSKTHNSAIHLDNSPSTSKPIKSSNSVSQNKDTSFPTTTSANVLNSVSCSGTRVILGTVIAHIKDSSGQFHTIRLVLDSGSEYSFITYRAAKRLGLEITKSKKRISGIGQTIFDGAKGNVSCTLRPKNNAQQTFETKAVVIQNISPYLPSTEFMSSVRMRYDNFELADPYFFEPAPVDFLLGADLYPEIITGSFVTVDENLPKLMSTIFGYVVMGKISPSNILDHGSSFFITSWNEDINKNLKKFWEIEEPYPVKVKMPEDLKCEEHFVQTHARTKEGVYIVRLPFKEEIPKFSNSNSIALKRFYALEAKLYKSPEIKERYIEFMQDYSDLGHMREADIDTKFCIPHHCVLNKSKIRVVFDGSVKTTEGSLNDFLMVGEKLQNDSRNILLNFRTHEFAFTCDIVKMFRNILVHDQDRAYQTIYWRPDFAESIKLYTLNTVTYGLVCSPYLALRVLKQLCIDEGAKFPLAAKVLENDIYVDDIATGGKTVKSVLALQQQIINLLHLGGFSLSKWASNCPQILEAVNESTEDSKPVCVTAEEADSQKILGILWEPATDNFIFKIEPPKIILTKRGILSTVAKLYDPLGFLAPTIFLMKSFIQILWKEGLDWDEPLSLTLAKDWKLMVEELPFLSSIRIPRFICNTMPLNYQIVGFADASIKGYCAIIYIRVQQSDFSFKVFLLIAKTKLAPVKTVSIPRLELCGAHLLAKLYSSLSDFWTRLPACALEPCFFTDSTIVLNWIRTPSYKLKTFVANRVEEIVSLSSPQWWQHIDSRDNSSDCGSRGLTPSELVSKSLWWNGPLWLSLPQEEWPQSTFQRKNLSDLPDIKKEPISVLVSTKYNKETDIEWMANISSYQRIIRIVAWIIRFTSNCQRKPGTAQGPLLLSELKLALIYCIKIVQQHYFFKNKPPNQGYISKHLGNLSPFADDQGILRVGGRLRHSNLKPDHKFPIILPLKCHFSITLVDYYHRIYLHPGPSLLQALIQTKFWIPSLRRLVKQRTFFCIKCYKLKQKVLNPIMGDLPSSRLTAEKAFLITGVDFAGPFMIRESLRRKAVQTKAYLCVFVCMSTKALHLEVVSSLSTESFLAAFDRFTSRRGLPQEIYSDCGTNFVGAANQMKDFWIWYQKEVTQGTIIHHSTQVGVQWKFNPPHAPHFGGVWEAAVKSAKTHMQKTVGETALTFEELTTLFARIESILNSRPLCPLSSSPEETDYLSPGHFLTGGPIVSLPEPSLLDLRENILSRWQHVKRMSQDFWKRWRLEYLSSLQSKPKWMKVTPNICVGDLVCLKEPNQPVLFWPMARVVDTHPGKDGVVRVATIKISDSIYKRPVVKLVPLLPLKEHAYNTEI